MVFKRLFKKQHLQFDVKHQIAYVEVVLLYVGSSFQAGAEPLLD